MEHRSHGQQKITITSKPMGLEEEYFYNGPEMQNKQIDSSEALLNFVSIKCKNIFNSSLDAIESVVVEVDEILLYKFDTEEEKNDHMAKLKFWGKE